MADHLISVMGMADVSALGSDVSSATAATVAPRVISPPGVPDDTTKEQHGDLSRALFGNDNDNGSDYRLPKLRYYCGATSQCDHVSCLV
jgi:hypothetical protein